MHKRKGKRFRELTDWLAKWVITVAGVAVIAAMFAMLALIVGKAAPLFLPASEETVATAALPEGVAAADVVLLGVDADLREETRVAGLALRDGRCGFTTVRDGNASAFTLARLPGAPESGTILSVEACGDGLFSTLWDDGTAILYAMSMAFSVGQDGATKVSHSFKPIFRNVVDVWPSPPRFVMLRGDADKHRTVSVYADGTVREQRLAPGKGLRARREGVSSTRAVSLERAGGVLSAALNNDGRLYLGTDDGRLISIDFSGRMATTETTSAFRDRRAITALAASGRDRGFVVLDETGRLRWLYSTTGGKLLDMPASMPSPTALALNARADNLATLRADGTLDFRRLDSSYPEAGWSGFFSRLLYEGYDKAAFVWQSTGSDASEPKLSLAPLIWGSLKAAVYALFFATPVALAAAVYLSQFAAPFWRAHLKPAVEMLAAVPSVVIGFLAALWLAPLLERQLGFLAASVHYDQRNSLVVAIAWGSR